MAFYRCVARFWDNLRRYRPGDIIEWDGPPSRALVPLDPQPEPAAEQEPTPEPKRRGRPPKR